MRCPSCNSRLDLGSKFCATCGSSVTSDDATEADPPDPLVGQLLGDRFRILHVLAEGGMGRVYAAEQAMGPTTRRVAIKVLLSDYAGVGSEMERFTRECATVVELEHPNTIKFYDVGKTADGDVYIAMELLLGPSLAEVLRDGPLAPERVDLIVGQICGSLQEAHDRGIVHRDLKPDNVIIASPGGAPDFVKVLDFGIAKRVGGRDPRLTPLGVVLGSPPYMSPEQFTLQDVDPRGDVYALGIMAYEMLTGRLPFEAKNPLEWAALHMGADPRPIDQEGVFVPAQMQRAIAKALSKHAEDRPQSMRDFYGEFTLGTGTLPPGRAPSMRPVAASRSPSAVPLRGSRSSASEAPTQGAIDAMSSERRSEPPPSSASMPTRLLPSVPRGASPLGRAPDVDIEAPRVTMPDLIPATVREPALALRPARGQGRALLWLALALVLLGALATGVGWAFFVR